MTAAVIRKQMKGYIDNMADEDLESVAHILSILAGMKTQDIRKVQRRREQKPSSHLLGRGDWSARDPRKDYIVDEDLTDEEKKSLIACEREYREHPENFTALEDINWY